LDPITCTRKKEAKKEVRNSSLEKKNKIKAMSVVSWLIRQNTKDLHSI
jgi:hypothetical protein